VKKTRMPSTEQHRTARVLEHMMKRKLAMMNPYRLISLNDGLMYVTENTAKITLPRNEQVCDKRAIRSPREYERPPKNSAANAQTTLPVAKMQAPRLATDGNKRRILPMTNCKSPQKLKNKSRGQQFGAASS